jgi:hypothetical protein
MTLQAAAANQHVQGKDSNNGNNANKVAMLHATASVL